MPFATTMSAGTARAIHLASQGEEIPLTARLMAVADAFSAMTTDRPYRKGMDEDVAMALLEAGAGTSGTRPAWRRF